MLNLQVIGNLGHDARLERGNNGEFISFSVAHTFKSQDRNGQTIQTTYWVSCIMNGKQDKLMPFLKKGVKVFVSGQMTVRLYKDKLGQNQVGINLNVRLLELCGAAPALPQQQQQAAADMPRGDETQAFSPQEPAPQEEDSLPF